LESISVSVMALNEIGAPPKLFSINYKFY
jgi:hypothetical protein